MATIEGTPASETLNGTAVADVLYGRDGDDTLIGIAGADTLSGGDGADRLIGGRGPDRLHGGSGEDTFVIAPEGRAGDSIVDFALGDRIELTGPAGAFLGRNAFTGIAGEYRVAYFTDGVSGASRTEIEFDVDGDGAADERIVLTNGIVPLEQTAPGSGILVRAADRLREGTAQADTLDGGGGNDTLRGAAGADLLRGGPGFDRLEGGDGDDTLEGGGDRDLLFGGAGADRFRFRDMLPMAADTIGDFGVGDAIDLSLIPGWQFLGDAEFTGQPGEIRTSPGAGGLNLLFDADGGGTPDGNLFVQAAPGAFSGGLVALQRDSANPGLLVAAPNRTLRGTTQADTLNGGAGRDTLEGRFGDDSLRGGDGDDVLDGGEGADALLAGSGRDRLDGGAARDRLEGGDGADTLLGGDGHDTLVGGAGLDTLRGGPGNDRFVLTAGDFGDRVEDFAAGDVLDLSAFGLAAVRFVGEAAFGGTIGEARVLRASPAFAGQFVTTRVEVDANGDGLADGTVELVGSIALRAVGGAPALMQAAGVNRTGTAAADGLRGGTGDDTLTGAAGDDILAGLGGNDRLTGNEGADLLRGGLGGDTLVGGLGDDTFAYLSREEIGAGETIQDLAAGDILDLRGIGPFRLLDEVTALQGFPGNGETAVRLLRQPFIGQPPRLEFDFDGNGVADASIALGGAARAIEAVAPGSGRLRVVPNLVETGTTAPDRFVGRAGDDSLRGGDGDDTLEGAAGSDTLLGEGGADRLEGGADGDRLLGGDGDDTLSGGDGNDTLSGGPGADRYAFLAGTGNESIEGLDAGDRIDLTALPTLVFLGEDPLPGGFLPVVQTSRSGNFVIINIDVDGNGFFDRSISVSGAGAVELTAPGSNVLRLAPDDTVPGSELAETLRGGGGDSRIEGLGGADLLDGGFGADSLSGGEGTDTLLGGGGNDILSGGGGDDRLVLGTGNDLAAGGAGADTFVFGPGSLRPGFTFSTFDRITDLDATDLIDFSAFGPLTLLALGANFTGGVGQVRLSQTTDFSPPFGTVTQLDFDLDGNAISDGLIVVNGRHWFEETAPGSGVLRIQSLNLTGTGGNDTLIGFSGNDTLRGGAGRDEITGGAGSELFVFAEGDLLPPGIAGGPDVIGDFTPGQDRIDLSAIDADQSNGSGSNDAFVFIGGNAFTAAGQARFASGRLQLNTDADPATDAELSLVATASLVAADLIL